MKRIKNNISKIILIEVLILLILIGAVVSNAQEVNSRSAFKVKPISLSVHLVKAVTTNDCHEVIQMKASTVVKEKAEADKKAEEAAKKKEEKKKLGIIETSYSGGKLSKSRGSIQGPSGKETYYNLNMNGVFQS